MNRDEIARYLASPTAPMPSYDGLRRNEPRDYDALVSFLADLRR